MKRENRYIVLKIKDIEQYCNQTEKDNLQKMCDHINEERQLMDKRKTLKCIVIESDWPEYEDVWSMIEKRIHEGEKL